MDAAAATILGVFGTIVVALIKFVPRQASNGNGKYVTKTECEAVHGGFQRLFDQHERNDRERHEAAMRYIEDVHRDVKQLMAKPRRSD